MISARIRLIPGNLNCSLVRYLIFSLQLYEIEKDIYKSTDKKRCYRESKHCASIYYIGVIIRYQTPLRYIIIYTYIHTAVCLFIYIK